MLYSLSSSLWKDGKGGSEVGVVVEKGRGIGLVGLRRMDGKWW